MKRLENATIAERLEAFAGLLDLTGSSRYTSRAYRRAAETIRETRVPIAELVAAGRVQELRGIGPGIAGRLQELVETGTIAELDDLERDVQPELVGLGRLLGVGPKRMVEIGRALGARTVEEFREAAQAGRLRTVPGVGPQTERRLLERLQHEQPPRERQGMTLNRARALIEGIASALEGEVAGDPRRWADASFDFAVVCATTHPKATLDSFERLPEIVAVLERDSRRAVGVTVEGVPVEVVAVAPATFGTELLRATGSQPYVDALSDLPGGASEEEVYEALGLPWCPPELREEPFRGRPPQLVELGDVRGDLHCHTTWSDGKASVLEMATAAGELGYEYIAICDHTPNVRVVPGLDADDLRRQGQEIAAVNERLAPFRVLRGTEVDIRADGTLDLPDDVLAELDWVQLSLHAGQRQAGPDLTRKVTEAMRHPSAASAIQRAGSSTTARRTPSISNARSRSRSRPAWPWRRTAFPTGSTSPGLRCGSPSRRASRSWPRPTPTRCAASATCDWRSPRPAAAGRPRPTSSTRGRSRSSRPLLRTGARAAVRLDRPAVEGDRAANVVWLKEAADP